MGGKEAIRGFAIQTLSVLLDALADDVENWVAVTLEPDSVNEKVDVLWEYRDGARKAQQVKSSQNQITKAMVDGWAKDLSASKAADRYELILAGPASQTVIDQDRFGEVNVPTPLSINLLALLDQSITRIDRYLTLSHSLGQLPLFLRETLVGLLCHRLTGGSITGKRFTRDEFDGSLMRWIAESYPEAIEQRLTANCEVLWSEIIFEPPPKISDQAFQLKLPVTIVNGGPAVAAIQWFAIRLIGDSDEMLYEPKTLSVQLSTAQRTFGEFAILPNSAREVSICFLPKMRPETPSRAWSIGSYRVELFVKYRNVETPRLVKSVSIDIIEEHFAALAGHKRSIELSSIDL